MRIFLAEAIGAGSVRRSSAKRSAIYAEAPGELEEQGYAGSGPREATGWTSRDRFRPAGPRRLRDRAVDGLASPVPRPVDAGRPRLRPGRLVRGGTVRPRDPQEPRGRSGRAAAPGPVVGPDGPRRPGTRDLLPTPRQQGVPGRGLLALGRGPEASGAGRPGPSTLGQGTRSRAGPGQDPRRAHPALLREGSQTGPRSSSSGTPWTRRPGRPSVSASSRAGSLGGT